MNPRIDRGNGRGRGLFAEWTPEQLPGLELWLMADPEWCFQDAGATVPCGNGDAIYTWVDQSGNINNAIQSTLSKRPLLISSGGLWRARFASLSLQELSIFNTPVTAIDNWSILYVASVVDPTIGGQNVYLNGIAGDNNGYATMSSTVTGSKIGALYPGVAWIDPASGGGATADTLYRSSLIRTSGITKEYIAGSEIVLNGAPVSSTPHVTGSGTPGAYVGSQGSFRYLNGDICELIVCSSALSDTDRTLAEDYLASMWGVP